VKDSLTLTLCPHSQAGGRGGRAALYVEPDAMCVCGHRAINESDFGERPRIEPDDYRVAYHEAGHCACAIIYNIPIISVSIDTATPHLHRGHYRPPPGIGLEAMCTLCLWPAAEELFIGPITDGSDQTDYEMARHYQSPRYDLLQIESELVRLRDAADRLVRTPFVQDRIRLIAAALLERGSLSGAEIEGYSAT
jgi:hypothetical protein